MPRPTGQFPDSLGTTDLATVLNVSVRRIQQLAKDGVIPKCIGDDGQAVDGKFPIPAAIHAFIAHVRESCTNTESEQELEELRKRILRLKGDREELIVANMRGGLHHSEVVRAIMDDQNTALRSRALAIPNSITRLLVGQTDPIAINGILTEAVNDLLVESKTYSLEEFQARNPEFVKPLNLDALKASEDAQQAFNDAYSDVVEEETNGR